MVVGSPDVTLHSVVRNVGGGTIAGATLTYTSDTPAVATVGSSSGVVHAVATAGSTTVASDAFTHGDNAGTLGSATIGGAWTPQVGTWGILGNAAYVSTNTTGAAATLTLSTAADTVVVDTSTPAIETAALTPILRWVDVNNHIRLGIAGNGGKIGVVTVVGGVSNTRMQSAVVLPASGPVATTIKVTLINNVVTAYLVGTQVGTPYTLTSAEIAAFGAGTACGMMQRGTGTAGTIDNFTALAVAAATITATSTNGKTGTVLVRVTDDTTPAQIVMSPQSLTLAVGGAVGHMSSVVTNAEGIVLPAAPVVYTSDTPSVATVNSATGDVTPVAAGLATLTGTSGTVFDTSPVTVTADTNPASVTINPTTLSLVVGGSDSSFGWTVKNAAGGTIAGAPVSFASNNVGVLTVTNTQAGVVHPVAAGSATVTVTETTNNHTATAAVTVTTSGNPNPLPSGGSYSLNTYHWPHKRQQWTDFGYHYRPLGGETVAAVKADQQLKAARVDQIMGGTRSSWTQYNPTVSQGPYVLILFSTISANTTLFNMATNFGGLAGDPTGSDATNWGAANGVDPEELFLHYYDGQTKFGTAKNVTAITALTPATLTVTAHGYTTGDRIELTQNSGLPNADTTPKTVTAQTGGIPDGTYLVTVVDANTLTLNTNATALKTAGTAWGHISNVLGDGTKTFANRRTITDNFGTHWPCNHGSQYATAYHLYRLTPSFQAGDFIFGDVMDSNEMVGFNSPLNPPISSLEYPCRGLNLTQTAAVITQWQQQFAAMIAPIRSANGNKRIQANIAAYHFPADREMGRVCGAVQLEQAIDMTANNGLSIFTAWCNSLMANGTQLVMLEGTGYKDLRATQAPPVGHASGAGRWKSAFYGYYMMIVPQDPTLCLYDDSPNLWTDNQATYYTRVCEAQVGHPTGLPTVQTIAVPGNGAIGTLSDKVFTRVFDAGLIVGRWPNDNVASGPTAMGDLYGVTVTLPTAPAGGSWFRYWDDGHVDTVASTSVFLHRIEAAVYILQTQGIQAQRADTFVDSIGTNIHMDATPYTSLYSTTVIPAIKDMGIRLVRSGSFGSGADAPINLTSLLASEAGTQFILVTNPGASFSDQSKQDYMAAHIDPSIVRIWEGPNEVDNNNAAWGGQAAYGANVTTFMAALKAWRDGHANATVRATPLSTPTVTSNFGATHGADWSSYATYGAAHPYPSNGQEPGSQLAASLAAVKPIMASLSSVIVTETGYETAPNATSPSYLIGQGVSAAVQAKYLPRLYAEYFKQGVSYTTPYEMMDDGTDLTNGENNFGLLKSDGTYKPVATSIKNLIAILGEKTWTSPSAVVGSAYVDDTFTRANASGWGNATSGTDTGKTWVDGDSAESSHWSIVSNAGVAVATSQIRNIIGDSHAGDVEYFVQLRGVRASYSNLFRLYGRWVDLSHNYSFDFNPGVGNQLSINKNASSTLASVSGAGYATLTNPNLRFRIRTVGSDVYLYGRIWDSALTEPTTWDVTAIDKAPASGYLAGKAAVWCDNNASGQSMKLTRFTASPVTVTAGSWSVLPPLTLGRLPYTLSGATANVQDLLLQKPDGFYLVLLNRVQSWNQSTKQDIANAPVSITVSTTATHVWSTFQPSVSASGTVVGTGVTSVAISVPDEVFIVKIV